MLGSTLTNSFPFSHELLWLADIAGKVYMTLGLKNTDLFKMWYVFRHFICDGLI